MRVIGTAGHVDHGKSTLVRAISGIDPDRLQEEKERGMTIDLGFAWLTLPSGEPVGLVDVPGHADFIKNMLAGVGGIDAALLVVAADEGVMPQTREHLDILNLLEISAGVVALTKVDLVDDTDWLELVQADLAEILAATSLKNAPIIPVSALTRAGLPQLLAALDDLVRQSPPRPDKGRPRLPVDRVFTLSGFGTIVTGTLLDGTFSVGQEVEILPAGLKTRIRGLQAHKKAIETVEPGSRVALNLTNISTTDVRRGDVITLPGWLEPSQLVDTRLRCLPEAAQPLKHNQPVDIFTGAAEVSGYLRLLGQKEIPPGEDGWVQLRLNARIPVVKGDRFIIRQPSPSLTMGGGVVVDPLPRRRHRRFRPELLKRLQTLADGTPADLVQETLNRLGPTPVKDLVKHLSLSITALEAALPPLLNAGLVSILPPDNAQTLANLPASKAVVVSKLGRLTLAEQYRRFLSAYHQANPLRRGMPRGELRSRLGLETGLFNKTLNLMQQEGLINLNETAVWLAEHRIIFSPAQQKAVDGLLKQFEQNPYSTPSYKDCLGLLNHNEDLLAALIEAGTLLRPAEDVLFLPQTVADFIARLKLLVGPTGSITVAQVRDSFNTTRKYALALLEYTDAQGITRRVGDERTLR